MPLPFENQTARDKLNKCKQEATELEKEVTDDVFIRFACEAWHLCDWVLNDPRSSKAAKKEIRRWKKNPPIPELAICQDVANGYKHKKITIYRPSTAAMSNDRGYGLGGFGKAGFGIGEQHIALTMDDGKILDAMKIVQGVLALWDDFFNRHALA
jgi:hypothetical protein